MIASIDRDADGIVTGLEETRHGLEDGDYVTFSEVKGMTELNGCEPRKVTVKGECDGDAADLADRCRSIHVLHRGHIQSERLRVGGHFYPGQDAQGHRIRTYLARTLVLR